MFNQHMDRCAARYVESANALQRIRLKERFRYIVGRCRPDELLDRFEGLERLLAIIAVVDRATCGWPESVLEDGVQGMAVGAFYGLGEGDLDLAAVERSRRQTERSQLLPAIGGDAVRRPGWAEDDDDLSRIRTEGPQSLFNFAPHHMQRRTSGKRRRQTDPHVASADLDTLDQSEVDNRDDRDLGVVDLFKD